MRIIGRCTQAVVVSLVLAGSTAAISESAQAETCTITVTESNVTVNGTPDADVVCVLGDYNTILTGAGDDQVIDEGIGNTIFLGEGNDGYTGPGGGGGTVDGGPGSDVITGTPGDDVLDGGGGDDTLIGGFGDDSLTGGDGADNLSGDAGADNLSGEMGPDVIDGGDGSDTLNGGGGDDTLVGGNYGDILQGGDGNDSLTGNDGSDQLYGEVGSDNLNGGAGDDNLVGGESQDVLDGGVGLNKCDYSDNEVRVSSCVYDDSPPQIESLTFTAASWDSTNSPVDISVNLRVTDEIGLKGGRILCLRPASGSTPEYAAMDLRIEGTRISNVGLTATLISSTFSGTSSDATYDAVVRLNLGTPPGQYQCFVDLVDFQNQRLFGSPTGTFAITRSEGAFDDQAPVVTLESFSLQPVDSAYSAKTVMVKLHVEDATGVHSGQFQCSMNINGNWYEVMNLGWDLNTPAVSRTATRVDFEFQLTVKQDTMPGTYTCGGHQSDVLGNHAIPWNLASFVVVNSAPDFDQQPPAILEGSASPSIVDVGSQDQSVTLSWRLTDATSLGWGYIRCWDTTNHNILDGWWEAGRVGDYWGRNITATISGTMQDRFYVLPLKIPFGTYPGTYKCEISASDTLQHWGSAIFTQVVVNRTPPGMPQAPTNLAFVPDATRPSDGVLNWSPPADLGSPALYDYEVEFSLDGSNWTPLADPLSSSTSRTITNLATSTNYQFRVRGNNGGNGILGSPGATWSQPALIRTPDPIVPSAPSGVTASNVGATTVNLSWSAPAYHGGSSVTDYKVEVSANSGSSWTEVPDSVSSSTSLAVSGLLPGTQYLARVSAKNIAGFGDVTQGQFTTLVTTPSKPLYLSTSAVTSSSLILSWSLPTSNGGSPLVDYRIEFSSNAGSTWNAIAHSPSVLRSINVTNLNRATTYLFRVSAVNAAGTGLPSDHLSVTTLASVPSSPTSLRVVSVTTSSASLAWTAPSDNGGSSITDYLIETSRDSGATWVEIVHPPSTSTSITISGMAPGTTYLWRVRALNGIGSSANASSQVTTNASVPSAVSGLATSAIGTTTLTLMWALPASNGGAPITDYRIEVSSDGTRFTAISHVASISRSFQVTGLAAGTGYWFRVSAINRIGTGPSSPLFRVVTVGNAPSAPTALSVKLASGVYTLSWKAAVVSGGSVVRDYLVEYSLDAGTTWIRVVKPVSTSTSLRLSTLLSRTTYRFRVIAVNDVGPSPASAVLTFNTA